MIAGTNAPSRIAESAVARARITIARFSELNQAICAATVPGVLVAIVASFSRFNDEIAASRIDADVGHRLGIADLTARTIRVLIAGARSVRGIAETAGARAGTIGTRLTNFQEARAAAPISVARIVIVASFAHFEHAIATTGIDTHVGARNDVAQLRAIAIRSFVTSADDSNRIAKAAFARSRTIGTKLPNFEQTAGGTAIAARRIVVIATFAEFDHSIATTGNDAEIGIGGEFADGSIRRAIGVFITNAR